MWTDKSIDALLRLLPAPRPIHIRYGATLALVMLSVILRIGFDGLVGPYGFILFAPSVVIAGLLFGWGCGLFAIALGVIFVGAWLDWSGPHEHGTSLVSFALVGAGLVFLADALHRALDGLDRARKENEMLLQEMSHRVKNKFAMIESIISLQSKAAPLEVRPALEAVARRVRALTAVHTHLQGSRLSGLVGMKEYIQELAKGLQSSAGHLGNVDIAVRSEPLLLPPREATAIGLIVNELIMNCYKYAFPDERSGKIAVNLRTDEETACLSVSDDGIGCTAGGREGMGTSLVSLLARQLGGTAQRSEAVGGGCVVTVTFPLTSALLSSKPSIADARMKAETTQEARIVHGK